MRKGIEHSFESPNERGRSAAVTQTLETYDALRARMNGAYDDLSPHLQRIARCALEDPNFMALETVARIAERVNVQPSTLIRFAKEFGYSGFSQMQKVFRVRLVEGAPTYRERVLAEAAGRSGDGRGRHDESALERVVRVSIDSLKELVRRTDPATFERAVAMLDGAAHVWVAGLRRSRPMARYAAYGLVRLERRCTLLDFAGGMAGPQAATMRADDLLFAIAFTEYAQPVVDVVHDAHIRGIPVLAITDLPSSPLARYSTLSFLVDDDTTAQFRPIAGSVALIQALMMSLDTLNR